MGRVGTDTWDGYLENLDKLGRIPSDQGKRWDGYAAGRFWCALSVSRAPPLSFSRRVEITTDSDESSVIELVTVTEFLGKPG